MTSKDIHEAMRLKDIAGWNQTHAGWERFLVASPEGCFAAEYAGRTDFTLVTQQVREIIGYAFGRRGSRADHLGPWMANNEDVAVILLEEFIHRSGRELVFVDCVGQNPWVATLLKTRGFEFSRPLTRMFRGANKHAVRPEFLCAIPGPEFG